MLVEFQKADSLRPGIRATRAKPSAQIDTCHDRLAVPPSADQSVALAVPGKARDISFFASSY